LGGNECGRQLDNESPDRLLKSALTGSPSWAAGHYGATKVIGTEERGGDRARLKPRRAVFLWQRTEVQEVSWEGTVNGEKCYREND